MRYSSSIVSLAAALCMAVASAHAFDELKYPDWTGQWKLGPPAKWDPANPLVEDSKHL